MGVEWVTGPGRRIELKTVLSDVSRIIGVRPGLDTHSHADQLPHRSGGSLSGHFNPRCRDGDSFLTLRCQASGHDGPMKRATWVFLITIVAAVSILCASDAPSGATTAQRPALCNALKPEIQADQRLPSILADMRSRTMSETKRQLLTGVDAILNTAQSLRAQLRSSPANVRSAFNRDASAEARFKTALGNATTKGQIRAAALKLLASFANVGSFIGYILSHCEGSARSGDPATT